MRRGITGILLAAGLGSRFGGGKLLHRLSDGRPMGAVSASNLLPACERLIAVLRPGDLGLAAVLAQNHCEIVYCENASQGMGHSLAAGVRATGDAGAWIVALGDMPFIDSATHLAVASSLAAGASLAATRYHGRRGHPVGFASEWYSDLSALTGDQGARPLLTRHADRIVLCEVDDPGVIRDIDHPGDLAHLS